MMPEKEDSQQGLPLARILPTSRDDQVQQPSQYKNKLEMFDKSCKLNSCFLRQTEDSEVKFRQCAVAKIYGTAVCIEAEAKRAHYLHEYPLYYFLGRTRFSYQLEPGTILITDISQKRC